jgi:hypothetical protein
LKSLRMTDMRPKLVLTFVFSVTLLAFSATAAQMPQNVPPGRNVEPPAPDEETYPPNITVQSAPSVLTLPAGTLITVRTTQFLSSDQNKAGDGFAAVLDQPVIAQGWVVARRGQTVIGRVFGAQKAKRSNTSSQLALELSELSLVDGQPLPIRTELVEAAGGRPSQVRNEGAAVGATTGVGAVIGAIAGGGKGAAIGAAVGAAAGVAGVLSTRGRPTEVYPEAQMTFRLQDPATIFTEQSRHAFLPVNPSDYDRAPVRNPERYPAARSYPPPPPPYYNYDWYAAPYNYLGFYGYFGPGFYVGPRIYIRTGHHRYR